jgi:hypothetical protein
MVKRSAVLRQSLSGVFGMVPIRALPVWGGGLVSVLGSLPEGQEFFRTGAKQQDRFRDRASALLTAAAGWEGEGLLFGLPNSHHALVNQVFISGG